MGASRRVVQGMLVAALFAIVAVVTWFVAAPIPAAPAAPLRGVPAQQPLASERVLALLAPADGPGCSAAVAVEGAVIWAGARGMADIEGAVELTPQTRFDIASVSKQFTATAILMLQREGLLSVSDSIDTYVDGLPQWGSEVTLDELIHHTSRIQDFWIQLDDVGIGFRDAADQATTLAAIARETELEPGEGYFYSNSNYVLLAEVVQRVSGQSLPDFLAARIFTPLGLDMVVSPTLRGDDIARPYDDDRQTWDSGWTSYGPVGIITTPSELARWGDQYRAGEIVQDDFAVGAVDEGAGELYAAGIDIEVDGDLNHTGLWGGFISDFTVSYDRETTIAVVCNGHNSDRFGIADALWAIWDPREG